MLNRPNEILLIEPKQNLTKTQSQILQILFAQQQEYACAFLYVGKEYSKKSLNLSDEDSYASTYSVIYEGSRIDVELTNTLARFERDKVPDTYRYAVVDDTDTLSDPEASTALVKKVIGTLMQNAQGEFVYKQKNAADDIDINKQRALKFFEDNKIRIVMQREFAMTKRHAAAKVKFPIYDRLNKRAALLMRFWQGKSLRFYYDNLSEPTRMLNLTTLFKVTIALLEALQCIHEEGIIHRDIKLDNIILQIKNDTPQVRIFDFGLAKLLPTAAERLSGFSTCAEHCGTTSYMSPEATANQLTDERSDLYSLCIILHAFWWDFLPSLSATTRKNYDEIVGAVLARPRVDRPSVQETKDLFLKMKP